MVLAGCRLRAAGFGLMLAGLSCATGTAPVKLAQQLPIAAGFVLDFADLRKPEVPPTGFVEGVGAALSERNLLLKVVGPGEVFGSLRETGARMSHLATLAQGAPFLLLCETKVAFFSQLNGKYKWQVFAKVSVARAEAPQKALSAEVEFPALLDFDHEREAEALLAVVKVVAYRAGQLVDRLLAAPAEAGPAGSGGGAAGGEQEAGNRKPAAGDRKPGSKVVVPRGADDLIYFVMVDRFFNGDRSNDGVVDAGDPVAFHGGDLAGVIQKLDYLQGLGVKTVWLSPVFKMRTAKFHGFGAFHGYWVEDLGKVEPRFGTVETLKQLSDALHARRMRLVLDFVVNHVGPDAPLARDRPEWFHHNGPIKDWEEARQLTDHDVHGLPDFAQEREDVYAFLLGKARYWIDAVKPDGFRLDAVKHVPLSFWRRFNRDVKAYAGEDFWMLGEVLDGRPSVLARYMREGEFDALFDFPVAFALKDVFCKGAHMGRLASVLSEDRVYDDPSKLVTLLDNHDLPRIASECGAAEPKTLQLLLQTWLTLRGTPSVTYGLESGLIGTDERSGRGDMRFGRTVRGDLFAEEVRRRAALRPLPGPLTALMDVGPRALAWKEVHAASAVTVLLNLEHEAMELRSYPCCVFPAKARSLSRDARPRDPSWPAASGSWTRQKREVRFIAVGPGAAAEGVELVGGGALGEWQVGHLLDARTDRGDRAFAAELPLDVVIPYKLRRRQAGGSLLWEAGENRYLLVKRERTDGPLDIPVQWQGPS